MSDFLRTSAGSIAIVNGDFVRVDGVDAVAQDVEMMLRTWLGESVYDLNAGMPYLQVIFADQPPTAEAVRFITEQRILSLASVAEVLELDVSLDRRTREMTISGKVRASTGDDVTFSLAEVAA